MSSHFGDFYHKLVAEHFKAERAYAKANGEDEWAVQARLSRWLDRWSIVMARQNGSAIRHAQPKHTAQPYWPPTPPQSGLYMPMADPSDEANAEANVCACVTFVAATKAGIPSFAASGGADAEAKDKTAADAETEAVAEIVCASPLPLEPTQPQRLRPDLPPNDLRLKLSRAHC